MTTTTTHETAHAALGAVAENLAGTSTATEWETLPDGRAVRASFDYEDMHSLEDDGDWYGIIEWTRNENRPSGFNGGAFVVARDRFRRCWLQPPEGLTPEGLASLVERVRDYYLDLWTYVSLRLDVRSAPCACCGATKIESQYLGAVESDTGAADLWSMLDDLFSEITPASAGTTPREG